MVPATRPLYMPVIMLGTREIMPANRIMEIPLPTPNSLHCSPSHIRKLEPATQETIMTRAAQIVSLVSMLMPLKPLFRMKK